MAKKPTAVSKTPAAPAAPAQQQPGTAVATAEEGKAMILVGDQQDLSHIKAGPGRGNENVKTEDLVIPRLEIVQSQSKCLVTGAPEFIDGAKQGDLINSVTRQNYGREVFIVPVHYAKQWLVWKDYSEGGGFFGAFPDPAAAETRLQEAIAEGNKADHLEIVDTPQHLCLIVDAKSYKVDEIMVPMAKTKAKVSRDWNTQIRLAGGDRFARCYRITTAQETNAKNQTYWNYVVGYVGAPNRALYGKAEKLFAEVTAGKGRVMDTSHMDGGTVGNDAEM